MAQVFISYAHVSPDKELAKELLSLLEAHGYTVFVDTKIRLGQEWVEQIDVRLREAEYFIVLLSAASLESDMVRREIALAHRLRKGKRLTILPVRLGFEGDLPYDIGAYLDLIQHTMWNPNRSIESMGETILQAIREQEQRKQQDRPGTQTPRQSESSAALAQAASAAAREAIPRSPIPSGFRGAVDPGKFDAAQLDSIKKELAFYVGPMAGIILYRATQKAADLRQLYELLALEIPSGTERKKFLAKRPP